MSRMLDLVASILGLRASGPGEPERELGGYRLIEPLGAGGMGEVWRGEHRALGRPAAIKLIRRQVLRGEDAQREEWLRRFEREARVTAALQSPHTVKLYDFGRASDGTLYYAMELLEGIDLEALVERFGPLEPARAVYLLEQLCGSLAEAHEAGLVHRDVKPQNLFLSRLGLEHDFVKVLDFGLVRSPLDEGPAARITARDMIVGTPCFMAPELVAGREVDGRTDLYAVGCVAYWLLTGTHVFASQDRSAVQVMLDHVHTAPELPSRRCGRPLPARLERLVMSCLEKEKWRRPRSALELLGQLRQAQRELPQAWTGRDAQRWWELHLPGLAGPALRARRVTASLERPLAAA